MSQLKPARKFDQSPQAFLLKENWNTASDLAVADEKIINFNDLLSVYKISHIPIFINAPVKVARTGLSVRPPRD